MIISIYKKLKKITSYDKDQIINYHNAGLNAKEIKKILGRKYTIAQISAVKAHATMGNYY